MLEKLKSYIIILLVLSLGFTPSVNAASDIFDEPRHIDYETYKNRMIEYIETPDYLKPSMPSIIGKNEYIDFMDIISASEDLLSVMPLINSSFNEIVKTSSYKNLNSRILNNLKETVDIILDTPEKITEFLTPFENQGLIREVNTFNNYHKIAQNLQDILSDNVYFFDSVDNPIAFPDTIEIDGNVYTVPELETRVSTATISPDGNYKFTDLRPLQSQVPSYSGEPLVGPSGVSVSDIRDFVSGQFYVIPDGRNPITMVNNVLARAHMPLIKEYNGFHNFRTSSTKYPKLLVYRYTAPGEVLAGDRIIQLYNYVREGQELTDINNERVDITPEVVSDAHDRLSVRVNEIGQLVGKKENIINNDEPLLVSYIESGVFFVLAIVNLVLACVYK